MLINVVGTPAPQGSKRAFVVNGHAVMTESSAKVKPWRQDVTAAVQAALVNAGWWVIPPGPVRVDITYYLPRPRYHYGTGKNAAHLKPSAPVYCDKKPDKDKLDRATFDALTASGAIRDDAQIAAGFTEKRYADHATGARITITPLSVPALDSLPANGAGTDTTQALQAAASPPGAAPARHLEIPAQGEGAGVNGCRATTSTEGALF